MLSSDLWSAFAVVQFFEPQTLAFDPLRNFGYRIQSQDVSHIGHMDLSSHELSFDTSLYGPPVGVELGTKGTSAPNH